MKILVVAPHPDDEVLGCGGMIAKHSSVGDEVYLCIVTKAYTPDWSQEFIDNRKSEISEANELLGIKETVFFDLPTAKLDSISQKELNDRFTRCIGEIRAEVVYIPHRGDLNKDHRVVFEACLVGTRPVGYVVKRVLSYEILSETEWGSSIATFSPNVYVDISVFFEKKLQAMKAYKSELKDSPHPRSLDIIDALARKRGSEIGVKYAESFELIREIIK